MADNLFLKADELGKQIRDKRKVAKKQEEQAGAAAMEVEKAAKQHEEDKREGMI